MNYYLLNDFYDELYVDGFYKYSIVYFYRLDKPDTMASTLIVAGGLLPVPGDRDIFNRHLGKLLVFIMETDPRGVGPHSRGNTNIDTDPQGVSQVLTGRIRRPRHSLYTHASPPSRKNVNARLASGV